MRKILCILIGRPHAGKTWWAEKLLHQLRPFASIGIRHYAFDTVSDEMRKREKSVLSYSDFMDRNREIIEGEYDREVCHALHDAKVHLVILDRTHATKIMQDMALTRYARDTYNCAVVFEQGPTAAWRKAVEKRATQEGKVIPERVMTVMEQPLNDPQCFTKIHEIIRVPALFDEVGQNAGHTIDASLRHVSELVLGHRKPRL